MPQMMPMCWLWLFFLCFLLIILTINLIYFIPPEMWFNTKSIRIKSNYKNSNWKWKWN